jgi:hypothetical protein
MPDTTANAAAIAAAALARSDINYLGHPGQTLGTQMVFLVLVTTMLLLTHATVTSVRTSMKSPSQGPQPDSEPDSEPESEPD